MVSELRNRHFALFLNLSPQARCLLLAIFAYSVGDPLLGVFLAAFLWKQLAGIDGLLWYQGLLYVGLSLGFIGNRYLLRRIAIRFVHSAALVLRVIPLLVLFQISQISPVSVAFLGLLSGIIGGFYWSSRLLLSHEVTEFEERKYFCSLEIAGQVLLSVLVPLLLGWFLDQGRGGEGAAAQRQNYETVARILGFVLIIGAVAALRVPWSVPKSSLEGALVVPYRWRYVRYVTVVLYALQLAQAIFPPLLVLHFLGGEFALGVVQSLASLLTAALVYLFGTRGGGNGDAAQLNLGVYCGLAAGVVLFCFLIFPLPPLMGILGYTILSGMSFALSSAVVIPASYDAISSCVAEGGQSYRLLVDREVWLTAGRITVLLLIGTTASFLQPGTYLILGPLAINLLQLALPSLVRRILP